MFDFLNQIVNGDVPPQMGGGILGMFMGQSAALPGPGASGFPGGAAPAMNADNSAQSSMESAGSSDNSAATSANQQSRPDNQPAAASEAASPTPAPTLTSTPTEIAPVLAVQTSAPTASPTATATPLTCSLVVNFNLNLRTQPDSEAGIITTIPFGSVVQTTGQNAGSWWRASYGRQSGWVSDEYVTPDTGCPVDG